MNKLMKTLQRLALAWVAVIAVAGAARAQEGLGPFMPNEGGTITTAWANAFGPDAESWMTFTNVKPDRFDISYSSSRGMVAVRRIMVDDRMNARALVLGYNVKMPLVIPGTTTLGTSAVVLEQLRSTGQAPSDLIYTVNLDSLPGVFTMTGQSNMSVTISGHSVTVPVIRATGRFQKGGMKAVGDFVFLNNRNNPVLLQYSVQVGNEKAPRSEQVVLVTEGPGQRSALEQALRTMRNYTTHGIHFDFDKASIRANSNGLLNQIAVTMKNNPLWTLEITGHTDSIGDAGYNMKLSQRRADSIKAALVKRGVASSRLSTAGAGAGDPIASNKTLQGRAQNRRVVLTRTDR